MLTIALGSCLVQPEPGPVVAPDEAVPDESFAIVAVTILDGEGFRAGQDVWDGRIRAVGQALNLPDGFARVDGRGRALMPGLIDSHVHTFGTTLNDATRFGVTSVLDQFTDPALAASKRAARGTLARGDEADLFSAGMLATAAGGHGTQFGTGMAVEPVRGLDEETSAPAAPETTPVSDFEDRIGTSFGAGWQVTADRIRGGSSTASLSAPDGALRVEGEVVSGAFAFPWSGAIYFPGPQPMQPVDFSCREVVRFRTRGDGRTYVVMLFDGSDAGVPPSVPFTAPEVWTQVEIPLARFPTATPGLIGGLSFIASIVPGTYAFEFDDVETR